MSLEKLAQDAYTQGLTDTLRNMDVTDQVKIAAYKQASLIGGALTGAIGEDGAVAGMHNEIDDALTGGLTGAGIGAATGGAVFGALGTDSINKLLAAEHARSGGNNLRLRGGRGRAALVGGLGAGILGGGYGMGAGSIHANLQNLGIIE